MGSIPGGGTMILQAGQCGHTLKGKKINNSLKKINLLHIMDNNFLSEQRKLSGNGIILHFCKSF